MRKYAYHVFSVFKLNRKVYCSFSWLIFSTFAWFLLSVSYIKASKIILSRKKNKYGFEQISLHAKYNSSLLNERRADVLNATLHHIDNHHTVVIRHAVFALKDIVANLDEFSDEVNKLRKQYFESNI